LPAAISLPDSQLSLAMIHFLDFMTIQRKKRSRFPPAHLYRISPNGYIYAAPVSSLSKPEIQAILMSSSNTFHFICNTVDVLNPINAPPAGNIPT
jgi:hypothetical protein